MKHIDMQPPRRSRIPIDHDNPKATWTPYPRGTDPVSGHYNCVFDRWCDLCSIAFSISRSFYSVEDRLPASETATILNNVLHQLHGWQTNLPACLIAETAVVPHIVSLQYGPHFLDYALRLTTQSFLPYHHDSGILVSTVPPYITRRDRTCELRTQYESSKCPAHCPAHRAAPRTMGH